LQITGKISFKLDSNTSLLLEYGLLSFSQVFSKPSSWENHRKASLSNDETKRRNKGESWTKNMRS